MQNQYADMMKMFSQFKMPDMGAMPQMPQMPNMGAMGAMPQMPDMSKMFSQFKMPQMPAMGKMPQMPDMSAMTNLSRRNIEAMTAANQAVSEGMQAVGRRQAELARSSVEKLLKSTKDMLVNGSPEINTTKQTALAKTMIEQSMSNLREVSEMVSKSSFEAFDVLNKRAAESFEEISKLAKAA